MRLKGQNFRILIYDTTANEFKCIGMATSCTVNLTANTEESSTKDDVGGSAKPEVTSNAWSVSCESLNVVDAGAMLTAIKSMTPFTLMWDKTSTTDNQTGVGESYQRIGHAYLNDIVLTFNDRENSAKSLQFTGTGPLENDTQIQFETISQGSFTKGQFVRLFVADSSNPALVLAGAKTLSLHVSVSLESSTTKDTEGTFDVQEPTGYTYDISTNALVDSGETIRSQVGGQTLATMMDFFENSTLLYWQVANVSGDNQRTKGSIIVSGSVILTQLTLNGPNRQNADYTAQMNGYGEYVVSA
jgi:hypothetical protein